MIVISAINLYYVESHSKKLFYEIVVLRDSFERYNYINRIRVMLRSTLNMANGYEPL